MSDRETAGGIEVVSHGNGEFRIVDASRSRLAYAAGPANARWVFLDGNVYVLDVTPGAQPTATRKRKAAHDEAALSAPMPATVVAINVEAGQRVATGDVMILLEAMKMELPIRSPRDGVVKAIACRAGELVQPGVSLLELE